MKALKVNYSLPAFLSNFSQEKENEKFTRAKLKMFYIGETHDKRIFTEAFAKDLIKSLPYTPVVSYYDSDKKDFIGHSKQQAIYGMVDPLIEPTFEKDENGVTWAVASVILYTERPDETGEIAKKIVGKAQSLEMDPETVEYSINYENSGVKNIEFKKGKFVGLSVLGEDQKPAFAGSVFFTKGKTAFEKLQEYCSNEHRAYSVVDNFIRVTNDEVEESVLRQVMNTFGDDILVVQWSQVDDVVVFWQNGAYFRVGFLMDNETETLTFGDKIPVKPRYLTEEEIEEVFPEGFDYMKGPMEEEYAIYKTLADLDLKPTETMANNAQRGLDLRKEYKRGGTAVGVARARDLVNRKNLSPETVQRMFSYFSRHEVDKKGKGFNSGEEGYPSAGLIAWLLWGGDAGFTWAKSKYNQIKKIRGQASLIGEDMNSETNNLAEVVTEATEVEAVAQAEKVALPEVKPEEMPIESMSWHKEEEKVIKMAWSCDGMEHGNCEQQPDGSWLCDGMKHDNCQKMSGQVEEKEEEEKKEYMAQTVVEAAAETPAQASETIIVANNEEKSQTTADTAALAESERAELEAYRLQEKLNCVNEYKLPKATLEKYRLKVSELTITELRNQLNEEFRLYVSGLRKKTTFLSLSQENDTTKRQSIKDLVEKYK